MLTVQTIQINDSYGGQYYLPYCAGILTQYALKSDIVRENCRFFEPIYYRAPIDEIVEKIGPVDVLAVSAYMWNWNISKLIGERIRKNNPHCFIVYGGPQIPENDKNFLENMQFMDMAAFGEGEQTFLEILEALISVDEQKNTLPIFPENPTGISSVLGTSYYDRSTNRTYHNLERPRMKDLSQLPSPYLDGYFEDLIKKNPEAVWAAMWESNRGCPFKCSFCDWGSIGVKVTERPWDELMDELVWFADHKIDFLFATDANFGIRKRDIELAKKIVETKNKRQYPKAFRVCYTKNSTEKIFEVAKIFYDSGLQRGVSLSMQSLHIPTLKAIQRDNIKLESFEKLHQMYTDARIPTFTELIFPLPEETYESFTHGINLLLESGQHDQILIYNCSILANAEMGKLEYQQKYKLKSISSPMFAIHTLPSKDNGERELIVVETSTMSVQNWKKSSKFAVIIQCFHSIGLLQLIAIFLYKQFDISYKSFYESFIIFAEKDEFLKIELNLYDQFLERFLDGDGLDQYLDEFGIVSWSAEEVIFLKISNNRAAFENSIRNFMEQFNHYFEPYEGLLENLLLIQFCVVAHWSDAGDMDIDLDYEIPEQIHRIKMGQDIHPLKKGKYIYQISKGSYEDKEDFATKTVWYGRRKGKTIGNIDRK